MSIASFFKKFKKKTIVEPEVVTIPSNKMGTVVNDISLSIFNFVKSTLVKNVTSDKYMIIDRYHLSEIKDDGSKINKFFIFKKNTNESSKVDDIMCVGYFLTRTVYFNDLGKDIDEIIDYTKFIKEMTLRDIRDTYFNNEISLFNTRYQQSYILDTNNVMIDQYHMSKTDGVLDNQFVIGVNIANENIIIMVYGNDFTEITVNTESV
jgi:hypothetical protein